MKKYAGLIVLILAVNIISAQSNIGVVNTDKKTYKLYLSKNWKELIKEGKKSHRQNIDFYFLNYRMGIAYYETKKYANAVKYFKKIYKETPEDKIIQEYLYFSYLLSGRFDDAKLLAASFDKNLKFKLGIESEYPFIHALYVATKHDINEDYTYPAELGTIDQTTVQKQSLYNISLEHTAGDRTSVFHGYSHTSFLNSVRSTNAELLPQFEETLNQNEYYFSLKFHAAEGLNIYGGFHFLHTSFLAFDRTPTTWGRRMYSNSSVLYSYHENAYAASLKAEKMFSIFNTAFGISVSNLNNTLQIQPSLGLRIYPFSNNTFYSETKGIYLAENNGTDFSYNPVLKQSFGLKFSKYSLIIPSITYGTLYNYTEYNGFIANNDVDKIKFRLENYINFGFAKGRFNIFINYQYNIKENTFLSSDVSKTVDYTNQTILGGIKWYFKKY